MNISTTTTIELEATENTPAERITVRAYMADRCEGIVPRFDIVHAIAGGPGLELETVRTDESMKAGDVRAFLVSALPLPADDDEVTARIDRRSFAYGLVDHLTETAFAIGYYR